MSPDSVKLQSHPGTLESVEMISENDYEKYPLRRACGCLRTSDKLKNILQMFPQPPPPTPTGKELARFSHRKPLYNDIDTSSSMLYPRNKTIKSTYLAQMPATNTFVQEYARTQENKLRRELTLKAREEEKTKKKAKLWVLMTELVSLIQLSVTATALALYYLIYCYMQLIYYTLRSAVYFHQADTPMKITIAIVTVTALLIGFNFLSRMEHFIGIHFRLI